ncbi:MAG: histidine phosphatase family protein [Blastocatellia bacterium]|nr:histidine phosphatase family protein [Blastocatellia bacterium]
MKIITAFFLGLFLLTFASAASFAQHKKLTIILLRHAEKDVSPSADKVNPDLTPEGKQRAQNLVKKINKYKPTAIYSSDYIRTKSTVAPLAEKRKLTVQMYDPRKLNELADAIMEGKYKSVVVVGHNNTTPALANLLIKQEKYQTLLETEYSKIWIIKIKKNDKKPNKIEDEVIEY